MIELNKIYNEDCIGSVKEGNGMWRIPDKSVDMILCDLPYQVSSQAWDIQLPLTDLWSHYERIIKDNGSIVLTATNPFASILVNSNLRLFKYEWIWDKEQGTNQFLKNKQPLRKHEQVLVFYKNQPTYNPVMIQSWRREIKIRVEGFDPITGVESKGKTNYDSKGLKYPTTILPINRPHWREGRFHPTQKPIALFRYLIETYTNENEIVLDNCIGSGTTAISCINSNRNYIGFELDETYYNKAIERINLHESNLIHN